MVSFHQWQKSLKSKPEPRQITWLCGSETVLVDEAVEYIQSYLGPQPWDELHLVVGEDSERSIWAAAEQHPLGSSPRLVIIRNAEDLKNWDRFIAWMRDRTLNPRTYLVLISNEERIPKTTPTREERRDGAKPEPLPHIAAIGARGHVVECRPFTSATAHHSIPWVQSKVRMREGVAKHLMERSDFNLRHVRDLCAKLAVFPGEPTIAVINDMLTERPRDSFADALLALDRKTALLALREIPPSDYGRVIGLLDSRLELAGMIHDMQVEHRSQGEITKAAGQQAFLVKDVLPVAKHYDIKRRQSIRKVLAVADEAYRSGQTESVMEALTLFW